MMARHDDERRDVPLHTIGALARLTGVPMQTLRNWERRYGLPRPVQSGPGSHRLYTAAEASLARIIAARVAAGTPIRKAVVAAREGQQVPGTLAGALEEAARRLDAVAARRTLAEAAALLPPDAVWSTVAAPALRALGAHWADTGSGLAAEHLATDIVRGWLHSALDMLGEAAEGPLIAIACGPFERHELGSLMLTLMLRERGVRTVYLGADAPLAALQEAASLPALHMLVGTATTAAAAEATIEALTAVADRFPPGTGPLIAYAGPGFASMEQVPAAAQGSAIYAGSDLDAVAATLSAQPSRRR